MSYDASVNTCSLREVWTMKFSTQLVIDAVCALILIALLVVPMLVTRPYQPQAKTNSHSAHHVAQAR